METIEKIKDPVHVLACFEDAETGKAMSELAAYMAISGSEHSTITFLHLTSEEVDETKPVKEENYQSDAFRVLKSKEAKNKLAVRTFIKRTDDKVAEIKPHLGAVLSIWPETWCHTLTELWSCGVPVIGFDLGAVGERITQTGAGWVLNDMQAESVECLLNSLSKDSDWEQAYCNVLAWQKGEGKEQNVQGMAEQYFEVYSNLIELSI